MKGEGGRAQCLPHAKNPLEILGQPTPPSIEATIALCQQKQRKGEEFAAGTGKKRHRDGKIQGRGLLGD